MKPQPMSDAEIAKVHDHLECWTGWGNTPKLDPHEFALAIIAARDAQWAAMIGEPVAWDVQQGSRTFLVRAADFVRADFRLLDVSFSPLYAIKETP